jgi:hypothetical protein
MRSFNNSQKTTEHLITFTPFPILGSQTFALRERSAITGPLFSFSLL